MHGHTLLSYRAANDNFCDGFLVDFRTGHKHPFEIFAGNLSGRCKSRAVAGKPLDQAE